VLSNSIQQLLFVITNGRKEMHARTLTSVCKSGIPPWVEITTSFWCGGYVIIYSWFQMTKNMPRFC